MEWVVPGAGPPTGPASGGCGGQLPHRLRPPRIPLGGGLQGPAATVGGPGRECRSAHRDGMGATAAVERGSEGQASLGGGPAAPRRHGRPPDPVWGWVPKPRSAARPARLRGLPARLCGLPIRVARLPRPAAAACRTGCADRPTRLRGLPARLRGQADPVARPAGPAVRLPGLAVRPAGPVVRLPGLAVRPAGPAAAACRTGCAGSRPGCAARPARLRGFPAWLCGLPARLCGLPARLRGFADRLLRGLSPA